MILFLLRNLRRGMREHDAGRSLGRHLLWLVVLSIGFAVTFKILEQTSWNEAFWQAWQTNTTVGYGNAPAATALGRLAVGVFGTFGIALVGICISGAFDLKQAIQDMRRYGMQQNPHRDGYVVFNFPGVSAFRMLVREIRTVQPGVGICVVDSRLDELPESVVAELGNLHFVRGDALDPKTYERAGIKNNRTILIFPLDSGTPDSDGATLTLVNILFGIVDAGTRIIPTLVNPENEKLFDSVTSRSTGASVCPVWQNIDVLAVVQECQDEHSAELVAQLLANTQGANPRTLAPGPCVGMTWESFNAALAQTSRARGESTNAFGLIHANGEVDVCPASDTVIVETDKLSIIAFPDFDWEVFSADLVT
ncbi:MAG: two pore domain potassium channel family protein [Lentisphaeria bacterium]|nr:two pore domain potassium channel family protein [Lentisphaeria bacterium]